jgi:hypothetical protein
MCHCPGLCDLIDELFPFRAERIASLVEHVASVRHRRKINVDDDDIRAHPFEDVGKRDQTVRGADDIEVQREQSPDGSQDEWIAVSNDDTKSIHEYARLSDLTASGGTHESALGKPV